MFTRDVLSGETFRFAAGGCVGNFATLWCLEKDTTKNMSTARNWWIFCGPKKKWWFVEGNSGGRTGKSHESWSEVARALLTRTKGSWSLDTYSKAITSLTCDIYEIFRYSPHNYWHHPIFPPKQWGRQACPACPAQLRLLLLVQPKLTGDMMPFRKVLILRALGYGDFIIRICGKKIHHPKNKRIRFQKKGKQFKKEITSPNHWFLGDMLVFRGVVTWDLHSESFARDARDASYQNYYTCFG